MAVEKEGGKVDQKAELRGGKLAGLWVEGTAASRGCKWVGLLVGQLVS